MRRRLRFLARALSLTAIGISLAIAVTIAIGALVHGWPVTEDHLLRAYVRPASHAIGKVRWRHTPGLRLSAEEERAVMRAALDEFFPLVRDRFSTERPIPLQCISWTCLEQYSGFRFREFAWEEISDWLDGSSPHEPLLSVGPPRYAPRSIEIGAVYWPYYGRLGVSIDYRCVPAGDSWTCREVSRYAIHWPGE